MSLANYFNTHYLPLAHDFLARSLRDVDVIVLVENKGVRLYDEIAKVMPLNLGATILVPNAIAYLPPGYLRGKIVGIFDDSAIYGRNLKRVSSLLVNHHCQIRCFAFAACNDPDAVQIRKGLGIRIDSALSLTRKEYDRFVAALGAFLRTREHSLPVDNTKFSLHFADLTSGGDRVWKMLLDQLAYLGTVTETWEYERAGRYHKASLHFPVGFIPSDFVPLKSHGDGVMKLRLFYNESTGIVTCNPMVFLSLDRPTRNTWSAEPTTTDKLYPEFREIFSESNERIASDEIVRLMVFDQLGFFLDCVFFHFILRLLAGSGASPARVTHDPSELLRYYGPLTGAKLAAAIDQFLARPVEPLPAIPITVEAEMADPCQGFFAVGKMETALALLRHLYLAQKETEPNPLNWHVLGISFRELVQKLDITELEGSIFIDILCDSGRLVPFNQTVESEQKIARFYRAAEDPGEENGKIIAYVLSRLLTVKTSRKRTNWVQKTTTEKVMTLLRTYLAPSALDAEFKIVRNKFGPTLQIRGDEQCADQKSYSLESFPTQWFESSAYGYKPTTQFYNSLQDPKTSDLLEGLNADPYLDRLCRILGGKNETDLVTMMAILAGREFGLPYVTADIELGLRPLREASARKRNEPNFVKTGTQYIGIGLSKLAMLQSATLVKIATRHIDGTSISDQKMLAHLVHLEKGSFQLRIAISFARFAYALNKALSTDRPRTDLRLGEQLPSALVKPVEVVTLLPRLLQHLRLGEPIGTVIVDEIDARRQIVRTILDVFYAISNVQCDYRSRESAVRGNCYFFTADLTNFTKIGAQIEHYRFKEIAEEAKNIVHRYAHLFGAFIAKPSEGDKFVLGFPSKGQALAAAACCFEHFRYVGRAMTNNHSFGIKCGLAVGEASAMSGGDVVGQAINISSRLSNEARNHGVEGGILATTQIAGKYASGEPKTVSIRSADQIVEQVHAVSVDSEKIVSELIKDVDRLSASLRDKSRI